MQSNVRNFVLATGAAALVSGCGMVDGERDGRITAPPADQRQTGAPTTDFPIKLGAPYQVGGVTYSPYDTLNYDEVGYASWYGDEMAGGATANGEMFNPEGISGAHKTLPLPSYVEVTSLDTGRTILVRLNDRGPFSNDRLIDLSRGAAEQLGLTQRGVGAVRVRRVNPPEQERAVLRAGAKAAERLETPEPLLAVLRKRLVGKPRPAAPVVRAEPAPVTSTAQPPRGATYDTPPPAQTGSDTFIVEQDGRQTSPQTIPTPQATTGRYVVQVGAFGGRDRAEALARQVGGRVVPAGNIYRVQLGPYSSSAEAEASRKAIAAKGYAEARVMANEAP